MNYLCHSLDLSCAGCNHPATHTHTNEASDHARYKSTALVGERISSGHECQVEEVVDMEHVWLGAFLKYSSHTAKTQTFPVDGAVHCAATASVHPCRQDSITEATVKLALPCLMSLPS